MTRLTILALGSRGDVQPYVALGKGLLDAGYAVRVSTFESFRQMVTEQNLDFHPVPGDAQALTEMMMHGDGLGSGNPFTTMRSIMSSFGQLAQDYIEAFSAAALMDSDAILNQLPGGLFGRDLAEKLGVPHITLSVIPLVPTRAFPNPLLGKASLGGMLNLASYWGSAQMLWLFFRPHIAHFRKRLGLSKPPYLLRQKDELTINGFSTQVIPSPADWGKQVHSTGYWLLDEPTWSPPADLSAFLATGNPPIFIGFGSMVTADSKALTETIIEAVEISGQRAIISSGWANLGGAQLSDRIFNAQYSPYTWLFPKMSAIIHHGGSGTTGLALRSGVPSMVVPFGADQHFWGQRTQQLGVGAAPIPIKHLTANNLADSIQRLTSDSSFQARAAELGDALQRENGIQNAVSLIRQAVR